MVSISSFILWINYSQILYNNIKQTLKRVKKTAFQGLNFKAKENLNEVSILNCLSSLLLSD